MLVDEFRSCPGGCGKRIAPGTYACPVHWSALPPEVRRRVNRAWRVLMSGGGDDPPRAIAQYRAAAEEADTLLRSGLGL